MDKDLYLAYITQANKISRGLIKLGIMPGDKIGLISHNNHTEWAIMDIGMSQIGVVSVPVYPTISEEDYEYIFNNAEIKYCFVSDKELYNKLISVQPKVKSLMGVFTFDDVKGAPNWKEILDLGEEDGTHLKLKILPIQLKTDDQTLIYTSGTTGRLRVIQPYENVKNVTEWAREIGYTGISHDLVFGLPFQNWECMENTIRKTLELKPDRLAFYSYAHVPWIKGVGQRGFDENDLLQEMKNVNYTKKAKSYWKNWATFEIGMDHFALPHDDLYQSMKKGNLHRNFMGYTSSKTQLMVGLGMSGISDSWYAFAQNEKTVEGYEQMVNNGEFPVVKGHILNEEDLVIRKHILNLMCRQETAWETETAFRSLKMLSKN
ncbi:hypothetical protein FQR65_LT16148 [Abscondita terminalis]|nr:hypothetical protein FQR65_LT16148 [Abscondita terminalis]